jgi:aminoglycoside phosphotransferase (APT) family kinase protein
VKLIGLLDLFNENQKSYLHAMSNTTQQKTRHELDNAKLGKYLEPYLPNLKLPIISTKIGYGQSNPTYFVDDANHTRYILRKKPSGTIISPVAHQVDREYKVLLALGSVEGFPVPRVYCLCMDTSIIGTAFYVRLSSYRHSCWY